MNAMSRLPQWSAIVAGAVLIGAHSGIAMAQAWPAKPIRVVVAFAPGGLADGVARLVGQKIGDRLGQLFAQCQRGILIAECAGL